MTAIEAIEIAIVPLHFYAIGETAPNDVGLVSAL
jgi:hypothetical protein